MSEADILRRLPLWSTPPEIAPVATGRTNRNFTVRDGERRYFVRIGKDLPHHGIDRRVERQALSLAAAANVAPQLVYAQAGVLVTDFIDGRTLSKELIDDRLLADIGALLARLHRTAGEGLPPFSPVDASIFYLDQLADGAPEVETRRIRDKLYRMDAGETRCLVHGDLIPENFIESAAGLRLVDWEYAGRGVPESDLALVVANFDLDLRQMSILLEAYGPHSPERLASMREAAIVREYLWCLVQARHGEPAADLDDYTELCRRRLAKIGL